MGRKRKPFSAVEALKGPCGCGCNLTLQGCLGELNRKYLESPSSAYTYFFGGQHRSNQDIPFSEEIRDREIERRVKESKE